MALIQCMFMHAIFTGLEQKGFYSRYYRTKTWATLLMIKADIEVLHGSFSFDSGLLIEMQRSICFVKQTMRSEISDIWSLVLSFFRNSLSSFQTVFIGRVPACLEGDPRVLLRGLKLPNFGPRRQGLLP
jgi:hypothetical protein